MKIINAIILLMSSNLSLSFMNKPKHFSTHTTNAYSNGFKESSVPLSNSSPINNIIKKYSKNINNKNIDYFEIKNTDKKNTDAILFFTGANSIIPSEIYSDFLSTITSNKFSVYVAINDLETIEELSNYLSNEYRSLSVVSHSTGAINAIELCNLNHKIKKLILMDPVDNRFLSKKYSFDNTKNKKLKLKYVDSVLFLNAKKSYLWSLTYPQFPFIPSFKIDEHNLISSEKYSIEALEYGHCDILNKQFSDVMHKTVSKGYNDRESYLDIYHEWLSNIINTYLSKLNLEWNIQINSKVFDNVEFNIKNVTKCCDRKDC